MIHYYIGDSAPAPALAQGVSVSREVGVRHQPEDCLVLLELEGHRGDVRHLGQGGHQDVGLQVVSKPARRQFQIMTIFAYEGTVSP